MPLCGEKEQYNTNRWITDLSDINWTRDLHNKFRFIIIQSRRPLVGHYDPCEHNQQFNEYLSGRLE
jgi:hypothetical protein